MGPILRKQMQTRLPFSTIVAGMARAFLVLFAEHFRDLGFMADLTVARTRLLLSALAWFIAPRRRKEHLWMAL